MALFRLVVGSAVAIGSLCAAQETSAADIRAAVAANFAGTLAVLAEAFQQRSGHRVLLSSGSTGKLYAQIKHGAPFDLFFAADVKRPRRLEQEGDGVPGTRFTYVTGRIVLWSPEVGRVDATGRVLAKGGFNKLAVANPATAPYGLAAQQTMERLGVWQALQPRLVRGENISQTYQFVASGNADLGFVALSQLRAKGKPSGSWWEVPTNLYDPIEQQVILLREARQSAAAKELLAYVAEAEVQEFLTRMGYGVSPD